MPGRKAKPPRLWFREDDETWLILDRGRQIRTGCSRDDINSAATALETYIGARHTTTVGATDPSVLAIADVLAAYEISKRPKDKSDQCAWAQHDLLLIRLLDLNTFFGDKTVSALKAQLCRDYVDWSTGTPNDNNRKPTSSRATVQSRTKPRDVGLRICGLLSTRTMRSTRLASFRRLPCPRKQNHRWLTRNEAARLLGAAIGYVWDSERKIWKRKEDGALLRRER
jgi:hypothetical protein